jgi:hypothetical protein
LPVVVVEIDPVVDCELVGIAARRGSSPAPGSLVLPDWGSIEERLEEGDAMETENCVEVDHSLVFSVVDVNSSPSSSHTSDSLESGTTPGTVGED